MVLDGVLDGCLRAQGILKNVMGEGGSVLESSSERSLRGPRGLNVGAFLTNSQQISAFFFGPWFGKLRTLPLEVIRTAIF